MSSAHNNNNNNVIAVAAAAGHLGQLTLEKLKQRTDAKNIIAIARNAEKIKNIGVSVREADYEEPEKLLSALQGVHTLLLISSTAPETRLRQHKNVIDAAKKAGVQKIAYTSVLHADSNHSPLLTEPHFATENYLKQSGITYVILRNGWYNENYDTVLPAAVNYGAVLGAAGEGKVSAAARGDYAEAAAVVLTSSTYDNQALELGGDNAFTLAELAAEIAKQSGKAVAYKNVAEEEYIKALLSYQLPEAVAKMLGQAETAISKGNLYDESKTLSKVIGRPTTPISSYVATVLRALPKAS
jgi:NAD(P)H dehydrogenase (quinone)